MVVTAQLHGNRLFVDRTVKQIERPAQAANQRMAAAIHNHHGFSICDLANLDFILPPCLVDHDKMPVRRNGIPFFQLQGSHSRAKGHHVAGRTICGRTSNKITVKFGRDEACCQIATSESGIFQHRRKELAVTGNAVNFVMIQRQMQTVNRRITRRGVRHQLGNHRVVIHRDFAALGNPCIHPHPVALWFTIPRQLANGWQKAPRRVLGIDTGFDGPSVWRDVILCEGQRFTGCDPDHGLDKVKPIDHFGHRMFHLQSGVHFKEVEILVGTDDEFHRAGRPVIYGAGKRYRLGAHRSTRFCRNEGAWRLFNDLLMTPLN